MLRVESRYAYFGLACLVVISVGDKPLWATVLAVMCYLVLAGNSKP